MCSCWRRRDGRSPPSPTAGSPPRAAQPCTSRASVAHATTGVVQARTHHGMRPSWARFWRTASAVPERSSCSGATSRYWLTYSSLVRSVAGAARATSWACTTSTSRAAGPSLCTSTCHAHAVRWWSRVRVTRQPRPSSACPVSVRRPSRTTADEPDPAPSIGQCLPVPRSRSHSCSSPGPKAEAACCTSSIRSVPSEAGAPPSTTTARRPSDDSSTQGGPVVGSGVIAGSCLGVSSRVADHGASMVCAAGPCRGTHHGRGPMAHSSTIPAPNSSMPMTGRNAFSTRLVLKARRSTSLPSTLPRAPMTMAWSSER